MTLLTSVIDSYLTNLSRSHQWLSNLLGQLEKLGFSKSYFQYELKGN